MINFNNKKTKRWLTALLILILIVAMVDPMVAYLIPKSCDSRKNLYKSIELIFN